jgi:ABC-type cobalt transport system substrate-binding protein
LWIAAIILVIAGIFAIIRKQLLWGVVDVSGSRRIDRVAGGPDPWMRPN